MTQTKKKTLIVLAITLILLLVLAVSFVGQSSEIASADSTTSINDTQQKLDGVMSNGNVHGKISTEGTRIETADQLRNFLTNGSGKGYLANNITDFSWDGGRFTRRLTSTSLTELNGNGYTITLTAYQLANSQSSPEVGVADGDDKSPTPYTVQRITDNFADDGALMTYAGTKDTRKNLDVHAGFIGVLRPNQTIRNCNFVYNQNATGLEYQTRNCATFGIVVGYSLGTIDNCSLTVNGNVKLFKDTNWTGSITSYAQETMSKHSAAMGGFVGTMSTNAVVSNSKIALNGNLTLNVQGQNKGSNEYRSNYARAWVGGIVGWMANGSKVYNILTEGTGNLDARAVNPQKGRTRSFSGIVAGINAYDVTGNEDSLAGKVNVVGTIKGVINNWRGSAKYLNEDAQFSPTNTTDNTVKYLVVGATGQYNYGDSYVSDIFMTEDLYSGVNFSIGFDYSVAVGTNGRNRGRYYSVNVIIQDVLGREDGSGEYKNASSTHAYLAFSGTEEKSPLWAVYDLKNEVGILWSKSVETANRTDLEYYYDKVKSIEEAKKYDVTHTEIARDQNLNYTIRYTHGKAVYFTRSYLPGTELNEEDNKMYMPSARYGEGLSAPDLDLYYDSKHTQYITTLRDKDYWVTISSSNNVPMRMTNNIVSPDTYESFLYIESEAGRDYSYIQFVNTTFRYVSYIYDDPDYQEFLKTHPGYEPIKNGEKQIDWQPRSVQQVLPRIASLDWGKSSDVDQIGNEQIEHGAIVSYGKYKTTYDGDPVIFQITVPSTTLLPGDTCSAEYEYRMLDTYTGKYNKVDSCVNAGIYKVVVTSLTNGNYTLAGSGEVDYCIDFEIEARQIGFINKIAAEQEGDTYFIKVPYEAKDIMLADEIEIYSNQSQAQASKSRIVLYNVLDKDASILKFDYIAYGEGELNMRNVGKFEMTISLLGGINSGNYILPEVTKYVVEIIPADAKLSNKTKFSYPYGFLVEDMVAPEVTVEGVDGTPLTFDGFTYYQKIDGKFVETTQEPFDVGEYQIKYEFLNEAYNNYNDASITVDVTIRPRTVTATYTDNNNQSMEVPYGTSVSEIAVKFERQGEQSGIIAHEYSSSIPKFRFNKLDENGYPTDIWVDKAVDAGEYLLEVGIDFKVGTTSAGWQIDENTKNNYIVLFDYYYIKIEKRTIYIEIKDVERYYGDALPELIGNANATEKVRAWRYTDNGDENNFFFADDNIVIKPYLSNEDIFAIAGGYYVVQTDYERAHMSDKEHLDDPTLTTYNKIDNYIINITYNGKYTIKQREVKVKAYLNTNSVIYGDALPEFLEWRYVGDKEFFEQDGIELVDFWGDTHVGSKVDTYFVTLMMKETPNNSHNNYKLIVEDAEFTIVPKTLTIIGAELEGDKEFDYDGTVHKPTVIAQFAEEVFGDDKIEFNYNLFEIVDGVMSTEATENPSYAGTYRAFISDASNPNYSVVFGEEYERLEIIMTINKRNVSIDVLPAYRIYSITGSLTPILDGQINEENPDYLTQEEAEAIYGKDFYTPYRYAQDTEDEFVQNNEKIQATMYIDEYYTELGVKKGVVKLVFNNLVPDPNYIDEEGNWITEEAIGADGSTIQIIVPRYRNYNININPGDLHVLGANLKDVEHYLNLRSSEEVYNGQDRYEDFRVITSNENIFNALKFRVFRYVDSTNRSVITEAEANNLARLYGKYTRELVDGKYVYTRNDAEGKYVRKYISRIENGDKVDEKLVDAGQYFKHITPADSNVFEGEYIMDFYITKAERQVSADDIKVTVNYNRISLSSNISGMEVSFDGEGFVKSNTFSGLKSNTTYVVKVRFAESTNYKQSDEIVLNLRTGIDIKSIQDTLDKYDKINFSNINEYESKVLAYIDSVSQADLALIDQAKYAKLQASYEQLLSGACSVIEGAQKVGATAVGKSGKTSSSAKTVALSMSGVSVLAAGFMFLAKRKKEDEQEESVGKKSKRATKRASKVIVAVVAVMLVCVTLLAGCDPSGEKGFSKADLYRIASYQGDGQNSSSRDLTIEVKSSGVSLYKYENGSETVYKGLDVSSFKLGADGIGFEFDDLFFTGAQFEIVDGIATFNADIKETLAFLGEEKAVNGKVSVTVDTENERLNTIDVSYDKVVNGITYNVTIAVKAKH